MSLRLRQSDPVHFSPDQSCCSSDAGDVLIRSTRILLPDPGPLPEPGSRSASGSSPGEQHRVIPAPPPAVLAPPPAKLSPDMRLHARTHRERQPGDRAASVCESNIHRTSLTPPLLSSSLSGDEVVTSRFSAGGRGVVLTALKQRSHSTPCRREVKVKPLDQEPVNTSSQDAVGLEAGPSCGRRGDSISAPLMNSSVEAQVRQMSGDIQRLLQSDRQCGRSLNQQVLQHMEMLHSQQLQLQSQLLDSAVRILSGHAPTTSTASGHTERLRVTDLNTAVSSKQHLVTGGPVTMVTPNQRAQHTSDPMTSETSANHSLLTATKVKQILREMKHLKTDMKTLLLSRSQPSVSSHQNQTQPNVSQSQSKKTPSHQIQSKPNPVHKGPVIPSVLEEARQVLRQVRRRREVLEENLASVDRAKNTEVLHCHLEALAGNRDCSDKVWIKKTVDAWIKTASRDIQAELSSHEATAAAAGSSASSGRGRPRSALKQTGSKTTEGRGGRGPRAGQNDVQGAAPAGVPGELEEAESYLTHLYGRTPYDSGGRTLKKTPYLHFSSPAQSPPTRKPRPHLLDNVRGVKMKSSKTQTRLAPPLCSLPGRPGFMRSADSASVIPLGLRWIESSSRCVTERRQEVTSPPAVVDETAERHAHGEERPDAGEAPPPPVIEMKSEEEEEDDDFPGTDFLSVADIAQEEVEKEEEEGSAVELVGDPSPPPPVLYQGPVFPPQSSSSLPDQDQTSVLDTGQHRDLLETRLVEWVEQQVMSKMISQMYCPLPFDPTHDISSDQSEQEEQSMTSDILEAAGGAGLQLFVDSSMAVDPALIRQLVNEVLAEIVASMLGRRDCVASGPELEPEPQGSGADEEDKPVLLVPTPKPTPPPSPKTATRQTTPPATPPPTPSRQTSDQRDRCPEPITAPELMTTPTPSPDTAPSAASPTVLHPPSHAVAWGQAELPLDEERPEERVDTPTRPLVMSVAEEEPPLPSPFSSPRLPDPEPDLRPASSSSDSVSSSSSSETTETDAVMSEGRLLISLNQLTTTTDDGALCSLSSSLQDMDHDPPSEGQVRGHRVLLSLRSKMETQASWGRQQQEEQEEDRDSENSRSPGQVTADVCVSLSGVSQVSHCSINMEPLGTLTFDLSLSPPTQSIGQVDSVLLKLSNRKKTEEMKMSDSSSSH
ncbi:protein TALPID3 isoform X2 [Solea solea]|uniref:protein TALPID3 isoform X2 n=1 Tax=Solea solea TaxID=90069 RepID=UPI00272B92C4|nr:protein TALPID3 isoform X2 [Solea solea]